MGFIRKVVILAIVVSSASLYVAAQDSVAIEDHIYLRVHTMPTPLGCSEIENKNLGKICYSLLLAKEIYTNLYYPDSEKEGIQVSRFVIEKNGKIRSISHPKSLGQEFDAEVDSLLVRWEKEQFFKAGEHDTKVVRVSMTLPIRFMNKEINSHVFDLESSFASDQDFIDSNIEVMLDGVKSSLETISLLDKQVRIDHMDWLWDQSNSKRVKLTTIK